MTYKPDSSQQKVLDCCDNMCVIAGAGSGKTGTLVAGIMEILQKDQSENFGIQNILALTFTEKAAKELRQRLAQAFRHALEESKTAEKSGFWLKQLKMLELSEIGTIHGFAFRLLKSKGFLLGLPQNLSVEELNYYHRKDLEDIIIDWLDKKYSDLLDLLAVLPLKNSRGAAVCQWLEKAINQINTWGFVELSICAPSQINVKDLLSKLLQAVQEAQHYLENNEKIKNASYYIQIKSNMDLLIQALGLSTSVNSGAFLNIEKILIALENDYLENLPQWINFLDATKNWYQKEGQALKKEIKLILDSLSELRSEKILFSYKENFLNLLNSLNEQLREKRLARGRVSFDDILILARRILCNFPELRKELQDKFHYLIVDEFQDTNRLQADILAHIINTSLNKVLPEHEPIWEVQNWELMPPKLKVYGDPKQSIYRFRGAEVWVMQFLRDQLRNSSSGKVLTLNFNYRSQKSLINFFNDFFPQYLGADYFNIDEDLQNPVLEDAYEGSKIVWLKSFEEQNSVAEDIEFQANYLVNYLETVFNGQASVFVYKNGEKVLPKPGDICLLFRRMRYAEVFEKALAKKSWPCQVVSENNPLDLPEIKALLAFYNYLSGHEQQINLVGYLCSCFVDISLETLTHLSLESDGNLIDYFEEKNLMWPEILSDDELLKLNNLKEIINNLKPWVFKLKPYELIELIVEKADLEAKVLSRFQGYEKWQTLKKFIEFCRTRLQLDHSRAESLNEALENLRKEKSVIFSDELLDEQAIKIMTVHKSKGLEFPVVVVPEMNYLPKSRSNGLLISSKGEIEMSFKLNSHEKALKTNSYIKLQEVEEDEDLKEHRRLFYVAATRAKDHLIFLGGNDKEVKGKKSETWINQLTSWDNFKQHVTVPVDILSSQTAAEPVLQPGVADSCNINEKLLDATFKPKSIDLAVTNLITFLGERNQLNNGDFNQYLFKSLQLDAPLKVSKKTPAFKLGNIFHGVLEKINIFEDSEQVQQLINNESRLHQQHLTPAETKKILNSILYFFNSSIGLELNQAVKSGEMVFKEMPFWLAIETSNGTLNLNGSIDLFFTYQGQGYLVDYKFATKSDLIRYTMQLSIYAQALRKAGFNLDLKGFLFFAGGHEVCPVELFSLEMLIEEFDNIWPELLKLRPLSLLNPEVDVDNIF